MNETAPTAETDEPGPVTEEEVFGSHEDGKLAVGAVRPISAPRELSIAYTPGVAKVSGAISENAALASRYTWAHRLVAVVSDGTAVLGLGDIGARAALPVMEGKSALFKTFADLNSIPIVLDTSDADEIVDTLVRMRPSFGAVNLEDIAAPRCFEVEDKLKDALDCPVMHDDQHGTAIVVLAALRGANTALGRNVREQRVVISGAGAAGVACARILQATGAADVTILDSRGILHDGRQGLPPIKEDLARTTNSAGLTGGLGEALEGADVFIGLSGATIDEGVLATMNSDAVVFALSNPNPEVHPDVAGTHASVVATGRSDYPNQINNVLAFPGVFRGALDAGARTITDNMKIAAADAIASVAAEDLSVDRIVPSALDPRVAVEVATAVAKAASDDGVV